MTNETSVWKQLSDAMATRVEAVQSSIVLVHGGGRGSASGVVWRPGIIVTVRGALGRREEFSVSGSGEALRASLIGTDAGTDLAVLRVADGELTAAQTAPLQTANAARAGELVLAVGRSRLGDISASMGIIARTGSAFRSWRGGQIDSLIRPDVRLYVGQQGSALVNEQGQVLGINSSALARAAVITVPAQTVSRVVDAIGEHGHVPRPHLGIAMQAVPVPATSRGEFSEGAEQALLVMHVEPAGAAAQGGLLVGDLMVSLNGEAVHSVRDFMHRLHTLRVGDVAHVKVLRGGAAMDLQVPVGDRA